jgi:hypothetical protein
MRVAPIMARSFTVPLIEMRPMSPPGEWLHDVRVGRHHDPFVAERNRGTVVHRADADTFERERREIVHEQVLDERAHRASATALLQAHAPVCTADDDAHALTSRSGTPP